MVPKDVTKRQNTTITAFHTDDSKVLNDRCVNFSKHCLKGQTENTAEYVLYDLTFNINSCEAVSISYSLSEIR